MTFASPQPYEQLEQELSEWSGVNNVVGCSSGTAALHLALEAFQLPPGEVIIPDLTMVACARAVTMAGHRPVFVDCDESLNMDPSLIEEAISKQTRAIMVVHVYGRRMDMEEVYRLAIKYRLKVIEDRAEFHIPYPPTEAKPDAVCWSFYRNKVVHGEEGGAIGFHDDSLALRMAKCLKSLGFTSAHDYMHVPRGHNYRLSNLHAMAIGTSLADYMAEVIGRKIIADRYDAFCPDAWRLPVPECNWVYSLRIPRMSEEVQRELVKRLRAESIEARHCFKPMHKQQEYEYGALTVAKSYPPKSERAAREVIYLPIDRMRTSERSILDAFDIIRRVVGSPDK